MATKLWVNPTRDFYNKGGFYTKGSVFELPEDMDPPRGSFEVKATPPDPVAEALKGSPYEVVNPTPTGGGEKPAPKKTAAK